MASTMSTVSLINELIQRESVDGLINLLSVVGKTRIPVESHIPVAKKQTDAEKILHKQLQKKTSDHSDTESVASDTKKRGRGRPRLSDEEKALRKLMREQKKTSDHSDTESVKSVVSQPVSQPQKRGPGRPKLSDEEKALRKLMREQKKTSDHSDTESVVSGPVSQPKKRPVGRPPKVQQPPVEYYDEDDDDDEYDDDDEVVSLHAYKAMKNMIANRK